MNTAQAHRFLQQRQAGRAAERSRWKRSGHVAATALLCAATCQAQDAGLAPTLKINGGVAAGAGFRLTERDLSLVDGRNSAAIGIPNANRTGRNADDGNLNYDKGDVYTSVAKAFVDFGAAGRSWRGLVRLQGWYDWALINNDVPFGHVPNQYQANTPLSDSGATARARFSNAIISNASVEMDFDIHSAPLLVSVGNLNLNWRGAGPGPSALASLDAFDAPGRTRPGAFAEESLIPIPGIKARLLPTQGVSIEAFYQFGFVADQEQLCGTFLAAGDRFSDSCNVGFANAPASQNSDQAQLAGGTANYAKSSTLKPSNGGNAGVHLRWEAADRRSEVVIAAARYDSRRGYTSWVRGTVTDTLVANGDARNPSMRMMYPEGIKLFVLAGRVEKWGANWYAEAALRDKTPLGFPLGEMFQTFTTANPATFLKARRDATPRGGLFQGWDTFTTGNLNLGVAKSIQNALGASRWNLQADVTSRSVKGLPDPNEVRYGRPEVFGNLQYPSSAPCVAANPALTCTTDGFVSSFAWGYTLRAQAQFPGLVGGFEVRPTVTVRHDVKGWAYDQSLSQGTRGVSMSIDAIRDGYTLNATIARLWGGDYQQLRDRGAVQLSLSRRF